MFSAEVKDFIGGFVTRCLETGSQAHVSSDKDGKVIGLAVVRGVGVVKHAVTVLTIQAEKYPYEMGIKLADECTEVYNRQKYEDCLNPQLPGAA